MMTSGYNITDLVQEAQIRWLKPGEVHFILQNYEEKQLTNEPPQKPPSGSLFLFNKRVLRFFRKDGHNWRRKKDGRTVGEAHERLKVGNVEALNCYYAHGELNPNFQRRCYWMLDQGMDHIVLVHYRDITVSGHSPGSVSAFSTGSSTLIQGSNSYGSQFTQSAAAYSQYREPYDNTSSPSSIEVSSDVVTKSNGTGSLSYAQGIEEIDSSPSSNFGQALRRLEEQLSLDEDNLKDISAFNYNAKDNSNESEFSANEQPYGGMQDDSINFASEQYPGEYVRPYHHQQQPEGEFAITSQQTSLWDDVLKHNGNAAGDESQQNYASPSDRNGVLLPQSRRDTVKEQEKYTFGYTGANNNSSVLLSDELEDFKFSAYTPATNLSQSYPDFYSTMYDQSQSGLSLESDSSLTIAQEQKFTIRELAPEWGYASEHTKVLIIGTFTCDPSNRQWYCMFGETEVPAEIIQEGVLCCYAPTHLPAKVTLCLTSGNRESCSEIREFEYRDKPNNYINNNPNEKKSRNSEELLLLVRFAQMLLSGQKEGKSTAGEEDSWSQVIEALLDGSLASSATSDWLLEELLKDKLQQWLSSRLQNKNGVTALSRKEQGMIHMVSGLGYGWALNPILKSGVGVNFRDINGWTALHWAARFGREKMVAELLASGANAGAVTDPSQLDPTGQTPASIAATCGHKGLAGYLSEVSLTSHPSLQLQQTELYRSSADIEAETAAVNGISKLNLVTNDDPSLKDTLAAVRNATQAAAQLQSAFRAHSFRKRQQKESYVSGDEHGILLSDIEGLSAASKLTFRNGNYNNAALSIQKKFRAWKGHKNFLALRQKVVTIQAHVRGHQVRKNYKVFCWAVGVVEKIVLRWRRKGVGLRGYKQELAAVDESKDEDIVKVFRKEKVDVSIDEAVSRVLSMVDSQPARQQYRRMLQKYRQAKSYTLEAVLFATNNFSHENLITESPLGKVYRGQTENLVIQRLDSKYGQGNELQTEILTLKRLEHKNIASFFAYWVENNENIIIYEASQGTLNQHLSDPTLTWSQRLQICIGVARALNHIHSDIIHCDINSSKIILDENWEPKIYGFELSTKYPRSWRHRLLLSHHFDTNNLTPKYDVYSFGVLLLEVLCGRKPMITKDGIEEELEEIIDPSLRTQMDTQALALFTNIAYKCLNQQHVHRPTMDQIIKELEDVLELQWEHTKFKGHSVALAADEDTPFNILKISLREIRQATNGFNKACFVGSGGYADVYRAKLDFLNTDGLLSMEGKSKDKLPKISKTVAIKRISSRVDEQGKQGFLTELELLTRCKHPNIVSLLGFCRELGEMILVYEYAFKGSLADYLISSDKTTVILPWVQRIKICLDIAHGISYLHSDTEAKPRIIHRDIKSDNILLDENMNAKLADFGLSKSHPMNQQPSTIYSKNVAGTTIYMDPEYLSTGKYKRESDIYSFGVVLFEVLSGRVAYDSIYTSESDLGLAPIARRRFNEGTLQELIDPKIIEEDDDDHIFTLNRGPNQDSFHTFSKIAYQCLAETQANRPTINTVIKELQNALEAQGEIVVLSRSRLIDIVSATENFTESYCIGLDTIGTVYKAELDHFGNNNSLPLKRKYSGEPSKKRISVAIKRITCRDGGQGKQEFFEEIEMRTSYQHPNIVPLLGFCNEGDEMILVYESVAERSLNDYFKSVDKMYTFTWSQRLYMCLDIARGLDHLHTKIANPQRIIHVDIKSANILLDKNRGAKIGYFVTSELRTLANEEIGMKVYKDPEYETEGKPKENSDVYSFGVILFEIFCGRLAYDPVYMVENDEGLAPIVRQRFDDGTIESMMDPKLKEETDEDVNTSNRGPNKDSLATFLNIAYQCLEEAAMRPNMRLVIKELEKAIDYHRD